jgi:hypothetical protein
MRKKAGEFWPYSEIGTSLCRKNIRYYVSHPTSPSMTKPVSYLGILLLGIGLLPLPMHAQPIIQGISPHQDPVEQYDKFEVSLDLIASYSNAYDYEDIQVSGKFTGPDGSKITVDGFFRKAYLLDASGNLSPDGEGFALRFAPNQVGIWSYIVSVRDSTGTTSSAPLGFTCVPRTQEKNQGFVRTSQTNYLQFDEGATYVPIGENMAWQNNNPYLDYQQWLGKLSDNGGNYVRLWHAHWGLGIEWSNNGNDFEGLGIYQQANSRYQDWLFDFCAEKGIYVMLCLQHHGQVSTTVNPNWDENPYNISNGGPCANTWDFFTDSTAIALTKNKYRYLMARWGYARSIMAWELWNEVEWTDAYETHQVEIMEWHAEMAEFLRSIDPYQHLITTSFAKSENDPLVWANPELDITQTHHYVNTGNIERVLAAGVSQYLTDYQKPTLTGEFGIGITNNLSTIDPDGIHLHNGLWGSLFGGGMGTGMSWWWNDYIEAENLYYHFQPLAQLIPKIPFLEKDMAPTSATVRGTSGDLTFIPTLEWGIIGEDSIHIEIDGTVPTGNPELGMYLYGSLWNTQYRSPPEFFITLPSAGVFSVSTSSASSGSNPQIAIYVDSVLVLQEPAIVDTSYSVNVPAGQHTIKVDNTGTDWITISAYRFPGLGSAIDAYVLAAADQNVAAGWVLNNQYNHQSIGENGLPDSIEGAEILLRDFEAGTYFVKWYDCLSGSMVSEEEIIGTNDSLKFPIPKLLWDLAFLVDDQFTPLSQSPAPNLKRAKLFPNPADAGSRVQIAWNEGSPPSQVQLDLIEMNGRVAQLFEPQILGNGWRIQLRPELARGMYWVRISAGEQSEILPILIR